MLRRIVVLPLPDGPKIASTSPGSHVNSTSSGIGAGLPEADRQAPISHGAAPHGATSAVVAISVGHGDGQQRRGHDAGAAVVEGLHAIVDGDAERARLARQVAADHQHDAELAERVRERQDGGGQDAGPRERHLDPHGSAATASGRSTPPRRARRPGIASKPR